MKHWSKEPLSSMWCRNSMSQTWTPSSAKSNVNSFLLICKSIYAKIWTIWENAIASISEIMWASFAPKSLKSDKWASWTKSCTSHVDLQVVRWKNFSTVAVKRCPKLLLLRWTLTALIHRYIPKEMHTIDRCIDHTTPVVNIDLTMVQNQWTLAAWRFRLVANGAAEIWALSSVVQITAAQSVIIAEHVLIKHTIIQARNISSMQISSMSIMWTAARTNKKQCLRSCHNKCRESQKKIRAKKLLA